MIPAKFHRQSLFYELHFIQQMVCPGIEVLLSYIRINVTPPALFRNSILAPEGFRMHRESGIELEGLSLFVKRFREEITNGSEQLSLACWCLLWDL